MQEEREIAGNESEAKFNELVQELTQNISQEKLWRGAFCTPIFIFLAQACRVCNSSFNAAYRDAKCMRIKRLCILEKAWCGELKMALLLL